MLRNPRDTSRLNTLNSWASDETAPAITAHQTLIDNTINDLEDRLGIIDERIQTFHSRISIGDTANQNQIQILEERTSAKQCLLVCTDVNRNGNLFPPKILATDMLRAAQKGLTLISNDPASERKACQNGESVPKISLPSHVQYASKKFLRI